jgi:hypothetical protein
MPSPIAFSMPRAVFLPSFYVVVEQLQILVLSTLDHSVLRESSKSVEINLRDTGFILVQIFQSITTLHPVNMYCGSECITRVSSMHRMNPHHVVYRPSIFECNPSQFLYLEKLI